MKISHFFAFILWLEKGQIDGSSGGATLLAHFMLWVTFEAGICRPCKQFAANRSPTKIALVTTAALCVLWYCCNKHF
jgi:hypothetical protein